MPHRHARGARLSAKALLVHSLQDSGASRWASLWLDAGGRIRRCSRRVAAIFGRRVEQLSGWSIQALIPNLPLLPATPGYNLAFVAFWHRDSGRPPLWGLDNQGQRFALDLDLLRARRRSGSAWAPIIRAMIRPRAVAGRADRGAADLDRYMHAVAARAEGVVVTDAQGSIVRLNRSAERMIGCPPDQLRGLALEQIYAALPGVIPRAKVPALWARTGVDARAYVESMTRPFVDRFGVITHEVHTLLDASDRVGADERLIGMARHDHLTELSDRLAPGWPVSAGPAGDRSRMVSRRDPAMESGRSDGDSPAGQPAQPP